MAIKKKKKNYNEILYELQKEAVLNKTGATDDQLKKQAAKQDFAQEKRYAPITKSSGSSKKTNTKSSVKSNIVPLPNAKPGDGEISLLPNFIPNGNEFLELLPDRTDGKKIYTKLPTTTKKSSGGLFSAFDDGYDIGDISKTIITGGKMLIEGPVKVGKGLIEDPKQTIKSLGVSFAEGYNEASELVDNSVSDIIDYITPDSWKKDKKNTPSVNVLELDKFAATASDEEKQQVLQEYEDAYGKDSPAYQSTFEILYGDNKNIFNTKYYDSETYKKKAKGELSEEQLEVYGVGENLGGMALDYSLGYMTGGMLSPGSTKAIEIASKGSLFLRSQQAATEQAIAEGYDKSKSRLLGVTVGGFEVGLESIGFDEYGATKELAKKSILKIMGGEALEEFIMPYVEHGAKTLYFGEEFDLESASEEALKSAGLGALTGAIMSAGGRGYAKTDSVINKINTGKEVTENDIISAAKEIEANNPGTIENAINQGTEALKQDIQSENETQKNITNQINELEGQLDTSMNPNQQQEVLNQINTLKEQYDTETQNITKQKQEQENAERELRRTNFTYDTTKITDEVEKSVYDSATKYFNNTARSHEFVERVAKISKDKGTRYSFINNEELQANGLNVEGKQVNGLVRTEQDGKPTILINIDSPKALNTIVGHETTHLLEGTQEYQELQQTIFEYAKTKGDLDTVRNNLTELYKDIENADIDSELTAELVGDYLFTDSKFIDSLAVEKPTLFQKIKELIDDLVVRFRGTKEERQLRQVQKAFKNAYSVSDSNNIDTKYSINQKKTLYTGSSNTNIQQFKVGGVDGSKQTGDRYGKGVYLTTNKDTAKVYAGDKGKVYETNVDDLNIFDLNDTITKEMQESLINELNVTDNQYRNSILRNIKSEKKFNDFESAEKFLDTQETIWKEQDGYYDANKPKIKSVDYKTNKATIEYTDFNNLENAISNLTGNQLYDALKSISTDDFSSFITGNGYDGISFNEDADNQQYVIYKNEDKLKINNNTKQSIKDNQGRTLTKEQQEYFKDSKVRDSQGRLIEVYHGTVEEFNTFYPGAFFTDDYMNADGYASGEIVMPVYLNLKNPLILDCKGAKWDNLNTPYGTSTREIVRNVDDTKYDGVIFENINDNWIDDEDADIGTVYYAFESNQIKDVDNTKPTTDADIRYSLSEDSEGNELKPTVQKWAEKSKVRDENGNLKVLYHGTATGEFTVFDKSKANPESDWGAAFYLTDSEYDVENNYEDGGADFNNKIARLAEQIEQEQDISYEDAEIEAQQQLYKGSYKITSYVNIENPAIVGQTYILDGETTYDVKDLDDYDGDLEGYYQDLIYDITEDIQYNVEVDGDIESLSNVLWESVYDGGIEIQQLKDKINELYLTDYDGNMIGNEVAREILEYLGYDGIIDPTVSTKWNMDMDSGTTHYITFKPNQIKNITNENPTDNPDINMSLSQQGQDIAPTGDYNVYGDEVKLQVEEAIAPLQEKIETLTEQLNTALDSSTQEITPVEQISTQPTKAELDHLEETRLNRSGSEYALEFYGLRDKYGQVKLYKGIEEYKKSPNNYGMIEEGNLLTEADLDEFYNQSSEVFKTITDEDAPTPMEDTTPDYDYEKPKVESPLEDRNIEEVGSRKVKAYQYEHPEVRPYFQEAALGMMYDLDNTTKGERIYNDEVYYNTNGEEGWMGIKRHTTDDIADLLDNFNYSYADIRKGLEAIIEDNGAENIAVAKRIEFALDDRLRNGYTAVDGLKMPANQEYIDLLRGKEIADYYSSIPSEDIAPIEMNLEENSVNVPETKNIAEKALKTSHEEIVAKPETTKEKPIEVKKSTNPIKPKTKGSTRDTLNYLFINRNEAIDRFAKETGNNNIKFLADHVNNVSGEISTNINKAQIDNNGRVIGKSIVDIFNQARDAKLTAAFEDYLFHLSNKARHKQGKGSLVPLTESKALIIEYEKAYPEMKKWAREVNKYNKQNLYKQVEADLYSKEFADGLVEKYEFYVPFFADVLKTYVPSKSNGIKTRGTVRLAEGGSNRNLLNFEEAMIRQTQSAITAIRKNQLYQEIVDSSPQVPLGTDADANGLYADENGYYLTAKVNGENVSAYISEDLYKGLENRLGQDIRNIEQKLSGITKPLQAIGNIRRNILTTWSPTFIITNPAKDIQDAPLNSKYAKDWAINYPIAFKELTLGKGEHLQEFLNMYGEAGIMGDYVIDSGVRDATKVAKTKKKLAGISRLNEMLELAPRYAEYLASLKNGTSQMEALYNAREVTTNFGRGGVITKALNRNGFTFLNASVQGFNKLYRNFSGENGAKGVVNASLKAVMLGVAPALFNALSYDDDEDYEALPDYIKDNYYLFKTDDGEFIRIPKGRMMSIFGSAARRALEATQGEENAFEGYLTNAYSQVGIQNPLESNILAPILQAYGSKNGKTWYGTDLVPTRLQDVPVEEQYDESTDKFSIWLGQTFGISPYKVNYIFDQYSGGIGDLLLPTITEEANSDGSFLAPLKDKFTANSTMDNKYASEFYTKRDKLQVNANSMYATEQDTLMSMYMDEVSWDMSALYKEKREVQNSDLSKKEKFERVQEIQNQINELAKEAINTYDTGTYTDNYASIGNYEFYKGTDYNGNEEWKTVYDYKVDDLAGLGMTSEEKNEYFMLKQEFDALNNEYYDTKDNLESTYGKHSDEFEDESDELYMEKKNTIIDTIMASGLTDDAKAYLYKEYYNTDAIDTITMSGIAVDYFLDYQKNDFKADYNSKGKAIPNSRKNKVIDYVNEFDLSVPEKAIIIKSTNTFKFNDYNDEIVSYIADLDISEEDKIYILQELDMTVDEEGFAHWE